MGCLSIRWRRRFLQQRRAAKRLPNWPEPIFESQLLLEGGCSTGADELAALTKIALEARARARAPLSADKTPPRFPNLVKWPEVNAELEELNARSTSSDAGW